MKIGIIFPERDWTAAEIALKIQGLAYSKDIECFISPKHTVRDDDKVLAQLKKCHYILFLAHDVNAPDPLTKKELELLKNKHIIAIIHNKFKYDNFHFSKEMRYDQSQYAIEHIQHIINQIHKEKNNKQKDDVTAAVILGLTALLMLLFLSTKKSK